VAGQVTHYASLHRLASLRLCYCWNFFGRQCILLPETGRWRFIDGNFRWLSWWQTADLIQQTDAARFRGTILWCCVPSRSWELGTCLCGAKLVGKAWSYPNFMIGFWFTSLCYGLAATQSPGWFLVLLAWANVTKLLKHWCSILFLKVDLAIWSERLMPNRAKNNAMSHSVLIDNSIIQ